MPVEWGDFCDSVHVGDKPHEACAAQLVVFVLFACSGEGRGSTEEGADANAVFPQQPQLGIPTQIAHNSQEDDCVFPPGLPWGVPDRELPIGT